MEESNYTIQRQMPKFKCKTISPIQFITPEKLQKYEDFSG